MSENSTGGSIGFGNTRYPYYYGPEGRLVLDATSDNGQLIVVKEHKKNEEVNN